MSPIIIVLFAAAAVIFVWVISGTREAAGNDGDANVRHQQLEPNGLQRVVMPVLTDLGGKLARLMPPARLRAMRTRIIHAGKQNTWNIPKAMALKVLSLMIGVGAALVVLSFQQSMFGLIAAGLFVVCGYFAVEYYLDRAASARQLAIRQDLPDVLDQVTVCVEAGLGFDASLNRCAASNENPLGDELNRTLQDIRLGVPRSQALNSLLERTDVPDLRLFVRAVIQAEKSGIPIARVLQVQSDEVREKRRQAAEERAMKLPVMLVMPLVLCILPSLFMVIMGPAVLRMINEGAV